jgi:hypothetical protein
MTSDLPDRDLTPTELRQLVESNARAIAANSDQIAANSTQMAQTQQDIQQLARIMQEFFRHQGLTNANMQDGLEQHQQRLDRIDPQN